MTGSELHAVILAAGLGQRLHPLTDATPKPLLPVAGKPILVHTLEALSRHGVGTATIVVGHLKEKIKERLGEAYAGVHLDYVDADSFETTNNIYSLWLARSHLDRDVLLLEGDVVFEDEVLERLLDAGTGSMAVAPYQPTLSGSLVRLNQDESVKELLLKSDQGVDFDFTGSFKTVNLYYLDRDFLQFQFVPDLCRMIERGKVDIYYESVLKKEIAEQRASLRAVDVGDCIWWEVDDHDDLERANYLFAEPAERYQRVNKLFGGHWRYNFSDHNHLYNLHFPPEEVIDGLRNNLADILSHYPPGQAELARLVANITGVAPEHTVVANGSSELIRIICGQLTTGMAIPEPSFNEYENSVTPAQYHPFLLDPETFELDVPAFAEHVIGSKANIAAVINPNNPTALSIPREDLLELVERLANHDCIVLVDESFIDFSCGGYASSLEAEVERFPNLAILKSMSKVFGIAGLRLGYLISANAAFREAVRQRLPIWNVNGFSEAMLRSMAAYKGEFEASVKKVREDYMELYEGLRRIPSLRVYKPDANFVFCRIESGSLDGPGLAHKLFTDYKILIKDCSNKAMPESERYLRIGSRTAEENSRLVEALGDLLA